MNAAREYRRLQSEIRAIVERLPEALNEHIKRQEAHPEFWCYTADLQKVRRDLLEVASFMGDEQARETLYAEGGDR